MERHVVVIRTSAGNSFVRVRNDEQVARAVAVREKRGEVVHHVGCSASCWCDGEEN